MDINCITNELSIEKAPVMSNNKKRCIHGKAKYWCKECGGAGICGHGKNKYSCKLCKYVN